MAFEIGVADDYLDMTDRIRKFVCGYGTHNIPALSGVGNGTIGFTSYEYKLDKIGTHPATINETWTITCTNAAVVGSEVWSVTGSVSGVQASATTGVDYINPYVDFLINDGGTNFVVSDEFTVVTTQGDMSALGTQWEQMHDDGYQTGIANNRILLKGKGEAGGESIYVALRPYADTGSDYHNILFYGASGYIPAPFSLINEIYKAVPMWNTTIPYWIHCNGRRFVISTKISTVYTGGYFGLILPYATPAQYPYPLCIAGNDNSASRSWSDEDHSYGGCFEGHEFNMTLLTPDNTWLPINNYYYTGSRSYRTYDNLWPGCAGGPAGYTTTTDMKFRENLDGTRTLLPYIFSTSSNGANQYGELQGVNWVSGFGTLASEDTLTIGGDNYVTFQGVFRTDWQNYWALKLD